MCKAYASRMKDYQILQNGKIPKYSNYFNDLTITYNDLGEVKKVVFELEIFCGELFNNLRKDFDLEITNEIVYIDDNGHCSDMIEEKDIIKNLRLVNIKTGYKLDKANNTILICDKRKI